MCTQTHTNSHTDICAVCIVPALEYNISGFNTVDSFFFFFKALILKDTFKNFR